MILLYHFLKCSLLTVYGPLGVGHRKWSTGAWHPRLREAQRAGHRTRGVEVSGAALGNDWGVSIFKQVMPLVNHVFHDGFKRWFHGSSSDYGGFKQWFNGGWMVIWWDLMGLPSGKRWQKNKVERSTMLWMGQLTLLSRPCPRVMFVITRGYGLQWFTDHQISSMLLQLDGFIYPLVI